MTKPTNGRLSPELERELVVATESGDESACRQLVKSFMPAIGGVARRYRSVGVEHGELMQEGVVGLLRAAKRYDPRMNTPFWAYASWWVRQAMQQHVAEMTHPVVLSDRAIRGLALLRGARRSHVQARGTEPSLGELEEATGFTRDQLDSLLAIERTPRGLEEPLSDEGAADTVGDMVRDPVAEREYDGILDRMQIQQVRDLAEQLGERERTVLTGHYGLGRPAKTLSEIGETLGITAERVRQIESEALEKLREAAASPPNG